MQPGSGDAGGMNVVERAQAEALAALGHHVELITRRSDPSDPDLLELAPNVVLRHIDAGPRTPLPKSVIDSWIDEFAAGLAQLGPYDLVHSHHWMSGVAAVPLARKWGIPHVQSFHSVAALPGSSLSQGEPPESPRRVPGEAYVAQNSDAVVAISAAEAHTVIERCGADPNIVHIVSPGVDHELFRPLRPGEDGTRPEWPNGYILFAARLQPLKGPDLAIAALAELPAELRPHLVVAGDTSADFADYAQKLTELTSELSLTGDVTFLGPQPRPELSQLMRGAKVVLVPSHSETFGLVALEAASSGVPVIAAAAGGLREAVAHGETGQLMDSRRPEDWGLALRKLLTQPGLLRTMGVVARVHARRFDWRAAAIRLQALYQNLIDG
jgi:D-inositol-3-phosphate glycosyltransferase